MAQLNIDQFVAEGGPAQETDKIPLLLSLVAGVGAGSVLAGIWSAGRVELGILPLGAGGMAVASVALFTVSGAIIGPAGAVTSALVLACVFLFLLGVSAGLFDVPLASYMQHHSPAHVRGAILAASNFMTFAGILMTALLYAALRVPVGGEPLFSAREVFLLCGIVTIPVMLYIVWLIPQATLRFVVWLASQLLYRIRVYGLRICRSRAGLCWWRTTSRGSTASCCC